MTGDGNDKMNRVNAEGEGNGGSTDRTVDGGDARDSGSHTHPLPAIELDERIAPGAPSVPTAQPSGGRAALRTGQKVGVAVAAACSVALIAVSAFFLAPVVAPEAAGNDALRTTVQPSGEADDSQGAGAQEADGENASPEVEGDEAAAEDADSAGASAGVSDAGSSASGGGGSSSSGSAELSGGSSSDPRPPAQNATVTVSVTVDSSAAGGSVSGGTTATFAQGATAYDALMACGLSVNASSSQYGVYVSAIGGLAEGEHGGKSGWMYSVNGATPGVSCSSYVLSDGDSVSWYYVTG